MAAIVTEHEALIAASRILRTGSKTKLLMSCDRNGVPALRERLANLVGRNVCQIIVEYDPKSPGVAAVTFQALQQRR